MAIPTLKNEKNREKIWLIEFNLGSAFFARIKERENYIATNAVTFAIFSFLSFWIGTAIIYLKLQSDVLTKTPYKHTAKNKKPNNK
jgi:hypothetical protein